MDDGSMGGGGNMIFRVSARRTINLLLTKREKEVRTKDYVSTNRFSGISNSKSI